MGLPLECRFKVGMQVLSERRAVTRDRSLCVEDEAPAKCMDMYKAGRSMPPVCTLNTTGFYKCM